MSRLTSRGLSESLLLLAPTLHTLVLDGCVDLTDDLLTEAVKVGHRAHTLVVSRHVLPRMLEPTVVVASFLPWEV